MTDVVVNGNAVGTHDATGKLRLSRQHMPPTVAAYLADHHTCGDLVTLRNYAGALYAFNGQFYARVDEGQIQRQLYEWLSLAIDERGNPYPVTPRAVGDVLAAIKATVPIAEGSPSKLAVLPARPDEVVTLENGLYHLPQRRLHRHDPALFDTACLGFSFDPKFRARCPTWLSCLEDWFEGDEARKRLLQQWAGYVLAANTEHRKILLMFGVPGSGKSTVAEVLRRLVGIDRCVSSNLTQLGDRFGLEKLLDKRLCLISDARFHRSLKPESAEALLMISGNDPVSIERKYAGGAITARLPVKFVMVSNDLPALTDTSGALSSRLHVLEFRRSFFGREDVGLAERLLRELPGIFEWAVEGWHDLRKSGKFQEPKDAAKIREEIKQIGSPVDSFVSERCVRAPGERAYLKPFYAAWLAYCAEKGIKGPGDAAWLGRQLRSVCPEVVGKEGTRDRFYLGISLKS